jgi:hypothetical protein
LCIYRRFNGNSNRCGDVAAAALRGITGDSVFDAGSETRPIGDDDDGADDESSESCGGASAVIIKQNKCKNINKKSTISKWCANYLNFGTKKGTNLVRRFDECNVRCDDT